MKVLENVGIGTEEYAIQALKDYVNSKKYLVYDTLSVFKTFEYPEEAKRLLED